MISFAKTNAMLSLISFSISIEWISVCMIMLLILNINRNVKISSFVFACLIVNEDELSFHFLLQVYRSMTDFGCTCDAIVKPQFHPPTRNFKTKGSVLQKLTPCYPHLAFPFQLNRLQFIGLCCLH